MKHRFFLKLALFVIPVAFGVLLVVGITMYIGEIGDLRQVAQLQMGSTPVLFGRYYKENVFSFKVISTNLRKPEVLVLGSSRVWQFRDMFFNLKPDAFYNASRYGGNIYQANAFLHTLEHDALPKILILGLDQDWFNPQMSGSAAPVQYDEERYPVPARTLQIVVSTFKYIGARRVSVSELIAHQDLLNNHYAIGLGAIHNGLGFRNDGSYQYGDFLLALTPVDERLASMRSHLAKHEAPFEPSDQVDTNAINELDRLLQFCKENQITVVAFSPPFAPSLYKELMQQEGHDYLKLLEPEFTRLFRQYDFEYFDFTDMSAFGITDEDMYDGVHTSEYVTLQMYLHMLQNTNNLFSAYSDKAFLADVLTRPNHFILFED
jgi:hypothetical protein